MYYAMRASAPSLHRESTDSLIKGILNLWVEDLSLSSLVSA